MSEDYSIQPYKTGDEKGIVKLLDLVFDGWPRFDIECSPIDHWKWKYLDNPYAQSKTHGPIVVAKSGEKIIGCMNSILHPKKIGKKIFLTRNGHDLAVHPDFRRRGIHNNMHELIKSLSIEYGVTLSPRFSLNPILIRARERNKEVYKVFPHEVQEYVKINDVGLHLSKMRDVDFKKKLGIYLLKYYNKIKTFLKTSGINKYGFDILNIDVFDDRINLLWNDVKDHYYYITKKTKDYLNWRYCDGRGGKYLISIAEDNDRILGYIVTRINLIDRTYPRGYVVDLLTLSDRLDVANALIENAINYFHNNEVNIVMYLSIQKHPYNKLFMKNEFMFTRKKYKVFYELYSPINNGCLYDFKFSPAGKTSFTYGDFDGI